MLKLTELRRSLHLRSVPLRRSIPSQSIALLHILICKIVGLLLIGSVALAERNEILILGLSLL